MLYIDYKKKKKKKMVKVVRKYLILIVDYLCRFLNWIIYFKFYYWVFLYNESGIICLKS